MKLLITIWLTLSTAALLAQVPSVHRIDTINRITDSLRVPNLSQPQVKLGLIDSLKQKQTGLYEKISSKADFDLQPRIESQGLNTLKNHLDSLRTIRSPDTVVSKYLISMKARSDSLQSILRLPPQTEEAARLQQQARDELNRLPAQVNKKLKLFLDQGANVGQLSGVNLPGSNIAFPQVGANLPGNDVFTGITGPSTSVPSASGGLSIPGANLPSTTIPQVGLPIPDSKGVSVPSLPDVKTSVPEIGNIKGEMGKVNDAMKEADGYKKDIKSITSGNIDSLDAESIEKRVEELDFVTDANSQLLDAAQQVALVKKWKTDPQYQQELAVNMAKEHFVNHFAGHENELKAGMEQLSKAKSKLKDVEEVADIFGKRTNPMKGKPFIERLRPGVNFQVQWRQIVLVDINPYVGYRITGRWTTGIGWNERVGFSSDNYSFTSKDRVYGPRAFVQFKLRESNFLILSPELMHATVPEHTVHKGESTSKWVPGLMGGYRREFKYSKNVIGTVQFMYNLVSPSGQSPHTNRFNFMIGFEFQLKKKEKLERNSP